MRHALIMLLAIVSIAPPAAAQTTGEPRRQLAVHPRIELLGASTDWSARDVAAFAAGAASMPKALLDRLDAPIRMRRVHHPCLSGIGRATQRCPTYDRDGAFLIYDMPPLQGEGRVQLLQTLSGEEREELQRRRAVVHAVMLANDRVARWSKRAEWRRINGWRASAQPFNRDSWGYSRYLGYRSARLDFVTFAEEWFVRPEDVIEPLRRERLSPDDSVECDAMSQHRFLSTLIAQLAPTWSANRRRTVPHCPAFEAWAQQNDLAAVEVVLAAASATSPQSMYGHLLLRLRYRDEARDRVFEFRPVTGTPIAPLTAWSRALLGGFHTVLEQRGADAVALEFQRREQRDLRRYPLRLTPSQTRRLLERIWEVERHQRVPFQFFVNNCASFLLDLIEPALQVDLRSPGLVVTPTDVIEVLDAARLLRPPRVDYAPRSIAEASIAPRRALGARLHDVLGIAPRQARELEAMIAQIEAREPVTRYLAYGELQQLLLAQLQRHRNDDMLEVVLEYLQHSVAIERYYADVALARSRATFSPPPQSVDDALQARRDAISAGEQIAERPEPPIPEAADLTSRQLLALNRADETKFTLRAAIDARDAVIERFAPKFSVAAHDAARREREAAAQIARDAQSSPGSGRSLLSLGGSFRPVNERWGAVDLRAAYLAETLGTQRQGGFRSAIELHALELALHAPVQPRFWELLDVDLTLLRFLTVERKLPGARHSASGALGWGGEAFVGHDGRRGLDLEGGVAGGVVWPIVQRDRAANLLLLGLYADARAQLGEHGRRFVVGGEAFARLRLHLGGAYSNALQLRVATRHGLAIGTPQHVWSHHGRVATQHRLGTFGRHELIASPWVTTEWTAVDARDTFLDVRLGASLELTL